jgi:hypothetical protein
VRAHPSQMCPAKTVLDCDQRGDPPEEHGVPGHEVHGQDGLGVGGEGTVNLVGPYTAGRIG